MLKDTIISAFNYDGTLLKWLKKAEKALQDDTLTNIEVVTNSDYSMQLKMTFGDGSFILSPSFTNKGRGIVSITKTATSGLVDTYTVAYTDNTTSTFTVTNAEGFNANNLYSTLTAGTGIELTNDGQNVTVTAKRLLNEIVDSQGRQRFIEGSGRSQQIEGFEEHYFKWSLSGTHLMLVFAGKLSANANISAYTVFCAFVLPAFIRDKIIALFSNKVTALNAIAFSSVGGQQSIPFYLSKINDGVVLENASVITTANDREMRIQVDLLIDTD